ncbi:flavin reductase family protein [Burkholderia sp. PU8-34]
MNIDPHELDTEAIYRILKGVVVPRPIGWVSSVAADGVANLAPFSFFTVVSRKPPIVSLSILAKGDQEVKDTLKNVRATGEFVVNVVSLDMTNQMHETSGSYPAEVDEFEVAGLGKVPGVVVNVPRVEGAKVSMECVVERIISVGDVGDHVVFGRIVRFHIDDKVWLERGRIGVAGLRAVGRLAVDYCMTDSVFQVPVKDD